MGKSGNYKGIGKLEFFLTLLCIIFFVDTVAPMSAMGVTAIIWALIIAVVFYIPSAMIFSEMGTTFPGEGGMYLYVKRAFGKSWGARVSYLYWLNNTIWTASVSTFFIGILSYLFFPNLPFHWNIVLMMATVWLLMFICTRSVEESTWIYNIATIVKLLLAVVLIICAVIFLVQKGQPANEFSWTAMKPSLSQSLTFMPALIYNFVGFEAMVTLTAYMKNPQKDLPKITLWSCILVAAIYIILGAALLIIIPVGEINLITAILDAIFIVVGSSTVGRIFIYLLGVLFMFTIIAQSATYLVAACRMSAAAADDNELPKLFGKRHKKHEAPVGSILIMGIFGTILVIIYGVMAGTAEELFWTFFSFVTVVYLTTFIITYQAYCKLQKTDDTPRPFRFPGPKFVGRFFAHFCQFLLAMVIILFFWVPGFGIDWAYSVPLLIGIAVSLIVGEILTHYSLKKASKNKMNE